MAFTNSFSCWPFFFLQYNLLLTFYSWIFMEGLILKLQYFGHLMRRTDSWKRPWWWERLKAGEEDEMVGRHHWPDGHEFEQALGVGDGQGGLACCSPWGCKESDTTERLNWIEPYITTLKNYILHILLPLYPSVCF